MISLKTRIETTLILMLASGLYLMMHTAPLLADGTTARIDFKRCYIDGVETAAKCFDIEVPLNWDAPEGRQINLHGAIIPAQGMNAEAGPLVVLAGGPGQAATGYGRLVGAAFHRINQRRDIILIDQRGTGRSNPLNCAFDGNLLGDVSLQTMRAFGQDCAAAQDVDVRYFSSLDILKDLEHVREWLGIEQVNLWGASYGTRLGLLYMKEYPASVRSAILDGVTPPNNSLFLMAPATSEAAWQKLVRDCQADSVCAEAYPNLNERLHALLDKLATNPEEASFVNTATGEQVSGLMTQEWFAEAIRSALYVPSQSALIPYAIAQAEKGDFRTFGALVANAAAWASSTMYVGSTMAILCREDVPTLGADAARAAGENSFHGDYYYRNWAASCAHWPVFEVPEGYNDPIISDIPTLLLSGGLDPITPATTAFVAEESLSNVAHFIADNAGHNVSAHGCAPGLMADFVSAASAEGLDGQCLNKPVRPPFLITPTGPRP